MVRRLIGYDRYHSRKALEQLNCVYRSLRWYVNFFQPMLQLQSKSRHGAKVYKTYDLARTPYQRVLESGVLTTEQETSLRETYRKMNPVRLKAKIDRDLEQLWALDRAERRPSVAPTSEATMTFR